jgi:hypothetical protein
LLRPLWLRLFKQCGNVEGNGNVICDAPSSAIVRSSPACKIADRLSEITGRQEKPLQTPKAPRVGNAFAGLAKAINPLLLGLIATVTGIGPPCEGEAAPPEARSHASALSVLDVAALQQVPALPPGATVLLQPGRYVIDRLKLPANTTLYAPKGGSIIGGVLAVSSGSLLRGITFIGGTVDLSDTKRATVAECDFRDTETGIRLDRAADALIVNNDFNRIRGAAVTGWGLDQSTITGNHFRDIGQGLDLHFNNDRGRGRNILIERNIFSRTTRMPIEVGPLGAFTENLVVRQNWADEFKNRGPDPGDTMSTFVAYSIVPTYGVNSVIVDNYANADSPTHGAIGIELDGSGTVSRNTTEDFKYGAIVYGSGFRVTNNAFLNASVTRVLNYSKRSGVIELEPAWTGTPRRPDRPAWRP